MLIRVFPILVLDLDELDLDKFIQLHMDMCGIDCVGIGERFYLHYA